MKIGILGGTFDPPHLGHVFIANKAIELLNLDEVFFIPTFKTPQKQYRSKASAKHRLKMVELTIQRERHMSVSNLEITRGGVSFTVDTLEELNAAYQAEFWLIIGSDALINFYQWKQPERILKLARLAVMVRFPHNKQDIMSLIPAWVQSKVDFLDADGDRESDISSTVIRENLVKNIPLDSALKPEVLSYIQEKQLYKI